MSINLAKYKNNLLFVPLGGANEIGINVNLYHYQGKWIMVDCGSGFADDHLPGVDMVVADLSFIAKHKENLLGLILTHAHEDHLGAIQYLWNEIECPVYATKFTKCFLKTKLTEYSFSQKMKILEIDTSKTLNLGPFKIDMLGLTHSAPEMQALVIRTDEGNVVHTGDWKFDHDPIVGPKSDFDALKKVGDEGVLALACDSTNVFNQGVSGSEGDVRENLIKIISECPKMVVVTTFASNLARLDSLIYAGNKTGRKICLLGRSMHRMFAAARESGYLQGSRLIIEEKSIAKYKREELLVIATGCQGEPLAATSKMANGSHSAVSLAPEDTVIFSSKIIPGNEKKIFQLFNKFVKKKVEVITERDHFVHVSGHPAIDELKKMYQLVRPQICIPVHGEPIHIHEQAKLAKANGIRQTIEVENGSVVLLSKDKSEIITRVENGYLAVDGNYLLPENSSIFRLRRRMRESGIVVASVIIDNKFMMACRPIITMPGLFDESEDAEVLRDFSNEIVREYDDMLSKTKDISSEKVESFTKKMLKRLIKEEVNKTPVIIVNVQQI
ncbi:MAG TPA: ribonuclease J [Candidatus Megaira endosymbiont of Nemacystus decipiens]|nr:ribonuclease J [Candidatus Megaera endosymbiont of Nemacystus decipiens]